jgi:Mannosyl-glycoprotein endo-beta-N-acetylglucosaminidase
MKKLFLLLITIPLWSYCNSPVKQMPPLTKTDTLTVDSLKMMVWSLPFKHKDIVIAQAILETGWFKSKNYQINNNLFGMKQVYTRSTTADSVINGYSHYANWRLSVIDYYLKQSVRENIIATNREQYFKYLDKIYSEVGSDYSNQLKDIIKRLDLDNDDPVPIVHNKSTEHKKIIKTHKKLRTNTHHKSAQFR